MPLLCARVTICLLIHAMQDCLKENSEWLKCVTGWYMHGMIVAATFTGYGKSKVMDQIRVTVINITLKTELSE